MYLDLDILIILQIHAIRPSEKTRTIMFDVHCPVPAENVLLCLTKAISANVPAQKVL